MKKLGIIGGLGPAASSYFYELITKLTKADYDQQHIEIILFSRPNIPDRSAFIMGESGQSPLPCILDIVKSLNMLGVDYIAIPCLTAHYFFDEIQRKSAAKIISMVEVTVEYLLSQSVKSAGILATNGTIASRILQSALENAGILAITPGFPDSWQQGEVMRAIKEVKSGNPVDFLPTFPQSPETILLACTELSLLRNLNSNQNYVDCMELLARRSIRLCGGRIIE